MNIYSNAPVDAPVGDAPEITKNAKIRFFINHQRQNPDGLDYPVLFREVKIDHDGKIAQGDIPANIPMFEQVTDSTGKVLVNRKNNAAHVTGFNFGSKGSGTKCVGCHAGHTQIKVPVNITEAQFTNLSTSANVMQSSYYGNYSGYNAIDRKARNRNLNVNWISNGGAGEHMELSWELPIDIREIKLYNVFPNPVNNTNISVNDCEVIIYRGGNIVKHISSTGALDTAGKSVPVNPPVTADRIRIIIKSYTGTINGMNRSALAEAEIIARVSDYESTGTGNSGIIISEFRLYENYPNPFNASTVIRFSLQKRGMTRLNIYDITGRLITRLIDGITEPGENSVAFSAENLASGIYFVELISGADKSVRKIVLMK
ncbi:MAG: T9SS type A sorting domain-containing protein [Ignavibacteria bacterium]|nr:T9SS type A sorting domain-containing protein [Ignavibacteria bacterium]